MIIDQDDASRRPYVFADYPRWLKHPSEPSKKVNNAEEEAAAAESGYVRTIPTKAAETVKAAAARSKKPAADAK